MISLYLVKRRYGPLGQWEQIAICPTRAIAKAFANECSKRCEYRIDSTYLATYGMIEELSRELHRCPALEVWHGDQE